MKCVSNQQSRAQSRAQSPLSGTTFGRGRVKLFCICSMHPCNPHRSCLLSLPPSALHPSSPPPLPLLPPSFLPSLGLEPRESWKEERIFLVFSSPAKKRSDLVFLEFLLPRCKVLISVFSRGQLTATSTSTLEETNCSMRHFCIFVCGVRLVNSLAALPTWLLSITCIHHTHHLLIFCPMVVNLRPQLHSLFLLTFETISVLHFSVLLCYK